MAIAARTVTEACESAKRASRALASADTETKDRALERLAELLDERAAEVLEANAADLADERAAGLSDGAARPARADRGAGSPRWPTGVRAIVALPDPVGEQLERRTLESGLDLRKLRVPLGVVAVIYEARPNVTVDCAALCLKSGNAIVLRGSSYAERSNAALAALVREAVAEAGLPEGAVELLAGDRSELEQLATAEGLVELVIPRGGEGLKQALKAVATVPVMYAAARQLPRLRARRRRPRDGAPDRLRRQGRPARGLQRGRDAARQRRRRRRVPARDPRRPRAPPGSSWSATGARRRGRRATPRSARRPTPTGTPSTTG